MRACTQGDQLGYTKAAGLPEITGQFRAVSCELFDASGVFTISTSGAWSGGDYHDPAQGTVYFSASRSNSIYGSSNTVSPASVGLPIIVYLGATT